MRCLHVLTRECPQLATTRESPGGNEEPAQPKTYNQKYQEDALEWEIANHSSILAWEIPWTEETDGLQSKGSQSWI